MLRESTHKTCVLRQQVRRRRRTRKQGTCRPPFTRKSESIKHLLHDFSIIYQVIWIDLDEIY